jgi:hypothetical protein
MPQPPFRAAAEMRGKAPPSKLPHMPRGDTQKGVGDLVVDRKMVLL